MEKSWGLEEEDFFSSMLRDYKHEIRAALAKEGLVEHRFRFDFEGSKVVYNI